jgi:hypothetical protein
MLPAASLGVNVNPYPASVLFLSRKPSAFVPLLMSAAALALVLVGIATGSVDRQSDEGAIAHIWQLLIAGQLPLFAYFVFRWLPRVPQQALAVLALQLGAALAAMTPVYLLGL